jgi:sugar-specific transcriptional regulator TrmB
MADPIVDYLQEFGLSKSEARAYLILLKNPDITLSDLGKKMNVSPPRIHAIMSNLVKKGVVALSPSKTKRYVPLPVEVATSVLLRNFEVEFYSKLLLRDKLLATLQEHGYRESPVQHISIELSGRKALMDFLRERIEGVTSEIMAMVTGESMVRMVYLHESEYMRAHERGVSIRVMAPLKEVSTDIRRKIQEWAEIKNLNDVMARILTFDRQGVIFMPISGSGPKKYTYDRGVYIQDPDITLFAREFLNRIWESLPEFQKS